MSAESGLDGRTPRACDEDSTSVGQHRAPGTVVARQGARDAPVRLRTELLPALALPAPRRTNGGGDDIGNGDVKLHVDGPSRAIDSFGAAVTLRRTSTRASEMALRSASASSPGVRAMSAPASKTAVRSVTIARKLSMALEGPSTCHLTSPSSFRPSRAARSPAAGWAEVGPQAHWSVAGTWVCGNGSGRAVAAYRGRIFIERPRIAAVQAAISRHAPEGRPPPSLSLAATSAGAKRVATTHENHTITRASACPRRRQDPSPSDTVSRPRQPRTSR